MAGDREVLEQLDLDALRARFEHEGFAVDPWPFPDALPARHAVVVRAVDPDHLARIDAHRWLTDQQALPTDRELRDWPLRVAEAVQLLRVATGATHADLGPTTRVEADFAARGQDGRP